MKTVSLKTLSPKDLDVADLATAASAQRDTSAQRAASAQRDTSAQPDTSAQRNASAQRGTSAEGGSQRTTRFRRVTQVAALLVAPWGFVVANVGNAVMTKNGESGLTAKSALTIAAAHPGLDKASILAAMLGSLILIPAVLGAMSLMRQRAARLGLIGGVLMIAGYVCYFALCFQGYATVAMAQNGGVTTQNITILDATQNQAFYVIPALTFVLGNIVGTFILGLGLMRARVIPIWAGVCIVAWPILHFVGGPWGEVAGAVVEAIGLAVVALRLLKARPVSDAG